MTDEFDEPLEALDLSKFMFIAEFLAPRAPEQVFERIGELIPNEIEDVYIRSTTIPAIPTLYVADLVYSVVRRFVQYAVSPRTAVQFESDMIQARCSNIEAMVFSRHDLLWNQGGCPSFNTFELVKVAKAQADGMLVGVELNNPFYNSDSDKYMWSRAIVSGADFIKVNNIWSEIDILKTVEAAKEYEIPVILSLQVPKGLAHLKMLADSPGVVIDEEYMALFKDVERDGMFKSIATKEAVRLLNLCELASAGAVVSADPSQLRYLRESCFGREGCK